MLICTNCGRKVKPVPNRFALCTCGRTDLCDENDEYAELSDFNTINLWKNGKVYKVLTYEDILEMEDTLPNMPFINEAENRIPLMSILGLTTTAREIPGFSCIGMINHIILMNTNEVYKELNNMEMYDLCRAFSVNEDGVYFYRIEANDRISSTNWSDGEERLKDIQKYVAGFTGQKALDALEYCLSGFHWDFARDMVHIGINMHVFIKILSDTTYRDVDILRYAKELYGYSFKAENIVDMLVNFDNMVTTLKRYGLSRGMFDYSDPGVTLLNRYFFAQLLLMSYQDQGILEFNRYRLATEDMPPEPILVDDMLVKKANYVDVMDIAGKSIPFEVTSPIISVSDDKGFNIALILNSNGNIYIHGDDSDDVKRAANTYWDATEPELISDEDNDDEEE